MIDLNLAAVDLNLLPALQALLRRRNMTRAAEDVGLSQPAMSRAVGRLRAALGDDLVVRHGRTLVLTPRAEALAPDLDAALAGVRQVYRPVAFDPKDARRRVVIAASDLQAVLIAPRLMGGLQERAPGVEARLVGYDHDIAGRIARGEVDFAFAVDTQPLPPAAASAALHRDDLVVVVRRGHPAAKDGFRVEDYARYGHVGVAILGDGASDLDARLAAVDVSRRIVLTTPNFTAALAAVAATDLVTTLSRRFASRFKDHFDLVLLDTPFGDTSFGLTLVWDRRRGGDPVLSFVRDEILAAARPEPAFPA